MDVHACVHHATLGLLAIVALASMQPSASLTELQRHPHANKPQASTSTLHQSTSILAIYTHSIDAGLAFRLDELIPYEDRSRASHIARHHSIIASSF